MEDQVNGLVDKAWDKYRSMSASKRLLIAIGGIPGSGKSSLGAAVAKRLNDKFRLSSPGSSSGQSHPLAAYIPMDGYHLTRAQLSAMPDPAHAHARRGAAFTINGDAYLALVKRLREPLSPETKTLFAPSFDHAVKDPVEDDIAISANMRIVIFEGNYVAFDEEPWRDARCLMDEVWFVDVSEEVACKRLVKRHMESGIVNNEKEARTRAEENDLVNGREINEKKLAVDEVVHSVEDASWKT